MSAFLETLKIGEETVWVEVVPIAGASTSAETAKTSATGVLERVTEVDLKRTLKALMGPVHQAFSEVRPTEATLELSLGLKGEVGVFVAKSEGNASLKVTVKWSFANTPPQTK